MSRSTLRGRLRLVRNAPAPAAPAAPAAQEPQSPAKWPSKSPPPVFPHETQLRMRAQSALCGIRFRDGGTLAPVLTLEQARDVLAWYRPQLL